MPVNVEIRRPALWQRLQRAVSALGKRVTNWDLAVACASGTIGAWLERRPRIRAAQPHLEGLAYLGPAGWAAITGARSDH